MKYPIYIVLILSCCIVSCDKDLLDVESTTVTDETLWQDAALMEAYIINLYTGIRMADKEPNDDDHNIGFGRGFHWAMWASITDEAVYSNDDQTYLVQRGQLSPANYGWTSTAWGRSYRGIREVNLALQNIHLTPVTEERRNMLIAELRFIRAYRYFDLLKGFGGVSLVYDEVSQLTDKDYSFYYLRNTIYETVDYIKAELDTVSTMLPEDPGSDWERGRATSAAALGLKSRLLLYAASPLYSGASDNSEWLEAAAAAKAVMDLNKFDLVTTLDTNPAENYRKLFLSAPGIEDIFFREYSVTSRTMAMERMNAPNGYGGWGGNCPMQNLVDDYEMSNGLPIEDPSSGYDDQDPYVNRDPRFYATILYNGASYRGRAIETFLPGGKDSPAGVEPWNTSPTGYYMRKFLNESTGLDDWNHMGISPWRYIRYAEILLNYAEAQNEAVGPDQSVHDAVNKIRDRAGMPDLPSGLTKDEMRERIRNERRIELAYEEHRYFDVRRWMIADDVENEPAGGVSITKNPDNSLTYASKVALTGKTFLPQHYWFPIPIEEINATNKEIDQNPGYDN